MIKRQEFALANEDLFGVRWRFHVHAFWGDGAHLDGHGLNEVLQPLAFGFPALIDCDGDVVTRPACARRSTRGRSAAGAARCDARASAARAPVSPVGFTASGSLARIGGSIAYASGATDLLSLASLLLPGQPIPIVHGIQLRDPRTLLRRLGFGAADGITVHHRPGDRRRLRRPTARHHPAVRHVERRRGPPRRRPDRR